MALSIKNKDADRLARKLARLTGESLTTAVTRAVRERLDHLKGPVRAGTLAEDLDEIAQRCAALPRLDSRSPEEIIGYDDDGLPN